MSYRQPPGGGQRSSSRPSYRQAGGARQGGGGGGTGSRWADAVAEDDFQRGSSGEGGVPGEYNAYASVHDEPEDWDSSDWVQRKTKQVQDDSLHSTRRALQRINDSENIAMNNMEMLNQQSEQLSNIETRLESTSAQAKVSDAKADHLKSLNRFFMIPSFGGKKAKKREEQASIERKQYEAKLEEARMNREQQSRRQARDIANGRSSQTRFHTTPANIERDNVEEEIDSNLNDISSGLARLKMMSQTMNTEITQQNGRIDNIQDRTEKTNARIVNTTNKVNRIIGQAAVREEKNSYDNFGGGATGMAASNPGLAYQLAKPF